MNHTILPILIFMLLAGSCSQKSGEQSSDADSDEAVIETSQVAKNDIKMYQELLDYLESAEGGLDEIPKERRDNLNEIAQFIQTRKKAGEPANLLFICTHNSRRSHLSQIWAATAAAYYGIEEGINTYSGGTEATAFNPRAVAAIERAGFSVQNPGGDNPHYQVSYREDGEIIECFSKKYDHPYNASESFAAVMTCSEADRNCPFIPGASLRVALPYIDPKESDGTDKEAATYDERCKQIATEMLYLMSQVRV